MRYTADRQGHKWEESTGQDKFLEKLYGSAAGRCLLKPLVSPSVSKLGGRFLDSGISTLAIDPFIRKAGINMKDYEPRRYRSYNDFFTRKLRKGARTIDMDETHFISPCDCRLSVYPVSEQTEVTISICDNGNGISDETLQTLHQELKKDLQQGVNHSSSGIGLINVHQRIKNYYGEEFGISVESNQGEYTCVRVRFPVLREEV